MGKQPTSERKWDYTSFPSQVLSPSSSCITDVCFPPLSNVCFKHLSKAPDVKLFILKCGVKHSQRHQPWKDQEREGGERPGSGEPYEFKARVSLCNKKMKSSLCPPDGKKRPLKTVFQNAILCRSQPLRVVSQSSKLKPFLWLPGRSLPLSSLKAFWF